MAKIVFRKGAVCIAQVGPDLYAMFYGESRVMRGTWQAVTRYYAAEFYEGPIRLG